MLPIKHTQTNHIMKLTLFTLLFPLIGYAQMEKPLPAQQTVLQDSMPKTSIYLRNRAVFYQKVFPSKLQKEELADQINTLLSTMRGFRFERGCYTAEGEFFGKLLMHSIDLDKFEHSLFEMAGISSVPFNATVVVQIKDYRYRVTVSEIFFTDDANKPKESRRDVLLDDFITKKNRSILSNSKYDLKLANYLNVDLTDLFDLNRSIISGEF